MRDPASRTSSASAPARALAHGGEGVGGFAGLGNGDDEVGGVDDGIAVSELGRLFDFGKDSGKVFDGVFSNKAGIHGGAATDDEDAVELGGLGRAIEQATAGDREERVFLRADKAITYDEIMQAMNALRAAGYVHVALVGAEAAGAAQ